MKHLMTGNEAVARGIFEAGATFCAAYPGTPSTEILENCVNYKEDMVCEWAPNEKVALESAFGASMAGVRSMACMKHVGVNVAADPLFTIGYTGVTGGLILISADDPGCHSSQNEQDNRYYAKFAKIPCIEPTNSQQAKDYVKIAYEISEKFDTMVLFRLTTRVCHSKGLVTYGDRKEVDIVKYEKRPQKFIAAPANARRLHPIVEQRLLDLEEYANEISINTIEDNNSDIGVITCGVSYNYAKEVFDDKVNYLNLGMTFPLPFKKIKEFSKNLKKLYVIEELEPFIEEQLLAKGIKCIGKEKIPRVGELNPDIINKAINGVEPKFIENPVELTQPRPPILCSGCPHRGFFYELGKKKRVVVTGDIGCYTLGFAPPLSAIDSVICMGASVSMGHGAKKAFDKKGVKKDVVAVIGDSTFLHTGINSLVDVVYNGSNLLTVILDNRITGMTGHQDNPGTGYTIQGDKTNEINLEDLVKAIGIKKVKTVNPLNLKEVNTTLNEYLKHDEPSVIITRWPCVLKRFSQEDKTEFDLFKEKCFVVEEECRGCKMCVKTGCPSISFNKLTKKAKVDENTCVGCTVCLQSCPFDAIKNGGLN